MNLGKKTTDEEVDVRGSEWLRQIALLAQVGVLSSDPVQRKVRLRLTALYPQWSFYVTALARPLRTLETPLLQTLLMPEPATSMGFGLLTLDQGRCLLCLLQDEALAQEVPLVGVWVDQRHETHEDLQSPGGSPAAWAAAAHFVKRRQAREKVWVEKDTFLVMSVVQTRATPASSRSTQLLFSEFRFEDVPGEEDWRCSTKLYPESCRI
eukprot:s1795_g6.t1